MSDDLISRSAVIAIIESKRLSAGKHNLSIGYALADVQEEIEKLNTVYKADKVVEQLEALRDRFTKEDFHIRGVIEKTIEIAKAGGVNEQ